MLSMPICGENVAALIASDQLTPACRGMRVRDAGDARRPNMGVTAGSLLNGIWLPGTVMAQSPA
jgi:hypothetical protein